jgi:hypothetical protein
MFLEEKKYLLNEIKVLAFLSIKGLSHNVGQLAQLDKSWLAHRSHGGVYFFL